MAGKKKKKKGLIVMMAVIVALFGLYAAVSVYQAHKEAEEQEKNAEHVLYASKEASMTKLHIVNEYMDMTLVQKDQVWSVEGREDFPLNVGRVEYIAATVADTVAAAKVTDRVDDLKPYGLDQPLAVIEADGADGYVKLTLGGRSGLADSFYIQREGDDALYTIGSGFYYSINRSEVQLLEVEDVGTLTNIQNVVTTRKDGSTLEFAYDKAGKPQLLQPYAVPQPVSETQEAALLGVYRSYYFDASEGYAKDVNLADYGLADPAAVVTVTYQDEADGVVKKVSMHIGDTNDEGDYYVLWENSGRIYTMDDKEAVDYLAFEPFQYVNTQVFAEEDQVWVVDGDTEKELSAAAKSALLKVVLERDMTEMKDGSAVLTLKVKDAEGTHVLRFYTYDGNNFYRMEKDGNSFFLVGMREVDAVMAAFAK